MTCSSHKLEVINELRIAFFNLLLNVRVYHGKGFTGTGSTENNARTKRVDDINPTVVPFLLVIETGGQIDGVFIFHELGFLHEALVFIIKYVIKQIILQQTTYPNTCRQKTEITNTKRQYIESCADNER